MENSNTSLGEEATPVLKVLEESDSDDDDLLNFDPFQKKKETQADSSPTSISTTLQVTEVSASPFTASPVKVTQDAEEEETIDVEKAEKRVKSATIPKSLKKPSDLYWCTRSIKTRKVHEPCRECPPDEALGLDIKENWDPSKKALVHFIECCWFASRKLVSRSSLTPYQGKKCNNEKERDEEQCEGKEVTSIPQRWCTEKLKPLERERKKKHWPKAEILQEKMYLQRVLDYVIEARDQTRQGEGKKEKDVPIPGSLNEQNRQPDEVETRDSNSAISDEDDAESVTKKRKSEPLRCGDVIEYYNPIFVFGDDMGLKSATINAIEPKGNPVLVLSSGDVLPIDTSVKRVKVMKRRKLYDNKEKADFNTIDWYILRKNVKKSNSHDSNIQVIADKLSDVIAKHQEKFKRKIKKAGLGDCTKMLTSYKRRRKS